MVSPINSTSSGTEVLSLRDRKAKKEKEKQSRKQFFTQVEGKYYCTYMVGEKGQRILISRTPIEQIPKDNKAMEQASHFEKLRVAAYHKANQNRETPEAKQEAAMVALHKVNLEETLGLMKDCAGVPKKDKCKQNSLM